MLENAFELLEELEATGGTNAKKEILERGTSNDYLKTLLYYAYNPFLKYNVAKYGEIAPIGEGLPLRNFTTFKEILKDLQSRAVTGAEAITLVQVFFDSLSPREYKWYSRVLLKDMRIGLTQSTVNKVWPKYIPTFECMLAKPWHKVKRKPKLVMIEPKLDGYRAVCFVHSDSSVEIFTRNGKKIEGFTQVEKELALMQPGNVYDAELTGKVNAFSDMQNLVMKKGVNDKQAYLNIFDSLPIEEFNEGKSKLTTFTRKINLEEIYDGVDKNLIPHIKLVETSEVMSPEDPRMDALYLRYLDEGYEGIMVKDSTSIYECKRTSAWLKIKPVETFDLEIIGYEEGEGKYEGMLGALIVEFKGYKVNVGTGYSDALRKEYWSIRDNLIGQTIEIEAQEATENKKGTESLRFPSFKVLRWDK